MNITNKTNCAECNSVKSFEHIYTFSKFPVYMGVSTNYDLNDDLIEDMIWVICKKCGCVQLETLLDPEVLYQKSHNPSIGKVWLQHHKDFAEYVTKFMVGTKILEIGGSNLVLSKNINQLKTIEKYTIYDKHTYESNTVENITLVNEYFTHESVCRSDFDNIINSHTFEHFYNPVDYLKNFSKLLKPNQKLIMSIPNIANMLRDGLTNALNFEHTFWIDKFNLKSMLHEAGFVIEDITEYNRYNLFISAINSNKTKTYNLNSYLTNKEIFLKDFIDANKKDVAEINNQLQVTQAKKFIFGCHIFTQYLLSFGLDSSDFYGILDNDQNKINHRLYGTNLMTYSPEILHRLEKPVVVLRAGIYTDEIKEQILKINKGTVFI